ncbi:MULTISPECIES: hypothetical protein [unclassified Oceanobacter]|uniref:hypothetical protein n=1 Tax=unclassified Oceanobacter TaxID=2620260 RepID=UPI0026E32AB7|nr:MULTISPECIES: hypothetical protein [unclassified Oceanobacter]MDO6804249.1 hypothetical protein [Wenyingzhuangia sp. 1_MG-2023]MDO6682474.1 hypothetical protein [Oceanobacter sp. 5_MG-2023]MDP2506420.1 hypothetical protein [Oceanobacter sp. 3_MG-2023]MDP2548773.1 hypothetical protein [Oceanobacter sp. 4_MG-2023]MDP2609198.1 hypothetical protein [Oceanobacter sp. 1_MG-2023]
MNKDQAYHQIALACLKSLRNTSASSSDAISELYGTIDAAFQQQFALVLTELEDSRARLNRISELDPGTSTLGDAQAIAQSRGTSH